MSYCFLRNSFLRNVADSNIDMLSFLKVQKTFPGLYPGLYPGFNFYIRVLYPGFISGFYIRVLYPGLYHIRVLYLGFTSGFTSGFISGCSVSAPGIVITGLVDDSHEALPAITAVASNGVNTHL